MDIIKNISESIYANLISGNSYLLILSGIKTTIIITVGGLFLGTILGAFICLISYSNNQILKFISRGYVVVVRGTPVLLLLMLLFYVVFAKIRLEAIYIAIVAFGLNSASHITEIIKVALESVDPGQVMAARTLGFTKLGAFYYITLPQAYERAKPVYQNTVISIIQWTSVVGYITIADITRIINTIGARTADPFFVIFIGILIYLVLAYITYLIFKRGGNKKRASR